MAKKIPIKAYRKQERKRVQKALQKLEKLSPERQRVLTLRYLSGPETEAIELFLLVCTSVHLHALDAAGLWTSFGEKFCSAIEAIET